MVQGPENDFDVVEVAGDEFAGVAAVQDEVVVVELLEDAVDEDIQDGMPDAGCEVASCIAVLHDVVVVGLDLQDGKIELGQGQIEEQDVQVEDEGIDESLEDTLDELAILDADEECVEDNDVHGYRMCSCPLEDVTDDAGNCTPRCDALMGFV